MLSRKTLSYLQLLNIGYWICIIPYRIIDGNGNNTTVKMIQSKGLHNILFKINITGFIAGHFLIVLFFISYDIWFSKELLLRDRALGLSCCSVFFMIMVGGLVTLVKSEEECSLVKVLLEFSSNAG